MANGKQRKTRIFISEQDEVLISGEANLKKYITKYYKSLFGAPEPSFVTMDGTRTEDIPQVTTLENEILTQSFLEAEVKDAIFQMNHNLALGLDGFPIEFYHVF